MRTIHFIVAGGVLILVSLFAFYWYGHERGETFRETDRSAVHAPAASPGETTDAPSPSTDSMDKQKETVSAGLRQEGTASGEEGLSGEGKRLAEEAASDIQMSSKEFKAWMEEEKEASARERGPEALNRYHEQKAAREARVLSRKAYREKLTAYREARREWKLLMDEAEERARATGDFREVKELRAQRPLPPRTNAEASATGNN
ncbi:MAG: hypothetical protein JW743_00425 [Deltaproteobacteria bacterium]|nr:hypothetical protein [Deltaproteobacteria bacterium]